jgi:hypothetical protein
MEKQGMMEIMERLLATINVNQAKADTHQAKMEADRKADKQEMLAEMKANQAKSDADRQTDKEQMLATIKANPEMTARMDAKIGSMQAKIKSAIESMKIIEEETMARQQKTEARLQEDKPASVDMTHEEAHEQEVPLVDAVFMPVGEPRKRRRDRRQLAAQGRQKEEQNLDAWIRGKQRDLVAARRGTTRRVQVARRHFYQKRTLGDIADPRRESSSSTGGYPAMQQGHGAGGTSNQKLREQPREEGGSEKIYSRARKAARQQWI